MTSTRQQRALGAYPTTLVGAVALAALALAGCGGGGSEPLSDKVEGKSFTSTSVEGHDLVPGSTIDLAFKDGTLVAKAGCNTMSAPWTDGEGDGVKWSGPAASTMMACDQALMDQDRWLGELLTTGMDVVDGDADLTLRSGDVTIALDAAAA
ncbi:MAG TPA: META domain-containing protein [Phycicoccus sp.]|nr:META domain-containing protein [Phycicoccus sp.]